jgi:hypothetical protein
MHVELRNVRVLWIFLELGNIFSGLRESFIYYLFHGLPWIEIVIVTDS